MTIQTRGGAYFDFDHPERHRWQVWEIAAALSKICRFTGNTTHFYSVAQHSVYVSRLVPWDLRLAGLLHDAHESVMGDVASPLKRKLPEYKALEQAAERSLAAQFEIPFPTAGAVKLADMRMLVTEQATFMLRTKEHDQFWPKFDPAPFRIGPLAPDRAEAFFLMEYEAIVHGWVKHPLDYSIAKGWVGP